MLDAITHGIVVGDAQGRITFCNAAALALHGFDSLEQVCGMTPEECARVIEIRDSGGRLVPPQEWPVALAAKGQDADGEYLGANRGRGLCWRARYSGRPVRDAGGNVTLAVVTIQDVTGLREAERALSETTRSLKQSERIYRAIGESIDYGVWVCAPDGRNLYASQSFLDLVGMTQEQCSDFGWGAVLHPDDEERTIAAWKECVRIQATWDTEHRCRGVDGQWHHVLARGIPVKDAQGNVVCWAGINLDLQAQKQAQVDLEEVANALVQANHELEAFSYSVSHDLRAPVRAIEGYATLMAEEEEERLQPASHHYLQRIRQGAGHMGRLIDSLLALSQARRQELRQETVSMEKLALAAWEECRQAAGERMPELRWVSPLPPATGDALMLHQVFANLLGNAVKYSASRELPVVEVGAENGDGESIYFVRDNGVGFDMKQVGRLFGVFQRLHGPREFEGCGVGLALARRIIERHGGRVWAQGAPGEGATFYFALP